MATSSPPASPSMRQQLDELDALLQRMLNLPANQTEEPDEPQTPAAPANPPVAHAPAAAISRGPKMVLLDGSAPVPPPQSPPAAWDPHWNINLNPQNGSSILGPRSPTASLPRPEPAPPVWRAETVAFAPPRPEPATQPPPSAASELAPIKRFEPFAPPAAERIAQPPAPAPLFPVVAVNRLFDTILLCFGPPGQWFCTSAGRNLLGYTGLALVVGSVVWAAVTCFGWPH